MKTFIIQWTEMGVPYKCSRTFFRGLVRTGKWVRKFGSGTSSKKIRTFHIRNDFFRESEPPYLRIRGKFEKINDLSFGVSRSTSNISLSIFSNLRFRVANLDIFNLDLALLSFSYSQMHSI